MKTKKKNPLIEIKSLINRIENKTILNENNDLNSSNISDIYFKELLNNVSDMGVDIFKSYCRDLSGKLHTQSFHEPFIIAKTLNEAFGDIINPDNVISIMKNRHNIPDNYIFKIEHFHKIYIYMLAVNIGENTTILQNDMDKLGYFLSVKQSSTLYGQSVIAMQFEPKSDVQEEVSDEIKKKYNYLYHLTPSYNVENIIKNGLTLKSENKMFSYPPRIYLMFNNGDNFKNKMIELGKMLSLKNNDKRNDGKYTLLAIKINDLKNKFYYDPNSPIGVYTEEPINKENIKIIDTFNFNLYNF